MPRTKFYTFFVTQVTPKKDKIIIVRIINYFIFYIQHL